MIQKWREYNGNGRKKTVSLRNRKIYREVQGRGTVHVAINQRKRNKKPKKQDEK